MSGVLADGSKEEVLTSSTLTRARCRSTISVCNAIAGPRGLEMGKRRYVRRVDCSGKKSGRLVRLVTCFYTSSLRPRAACQGHSVNCFLLFLPRSSSTSIHICVFSRSPSLPFSSLTHMKAPPFSLGSAYIINRSIKVAPSLRPSRPGRRVLAVGRRDRYWPPRKGGRVLHLSTKRRVQRK